MAEYLDKAVTSNNYLIKIILLISERGLRFIFNTDSEFIIARNQQLTELEYLGKEYRITFELFITQYGSGYQSVLHLTTGGDDSAYGDRTPGVWLYNDNVVHVASAINGQANMYKNLLPMIEPGKWIHFEITQTLMGTQVQQRQDLSKIYYKFCTIVHV